MILIPKPIRERNKARLDFVREMPCLVLTDGSPTAALNHISITDCHWTKPTEAHHIRKGSKSGVGTKPSDFRTIPLCQAAHYEYHQSGHDIFVATYELDLEEHIQRINREFEKLQAKPKCKRKASWKKAPGLKSIVVQCPGCGHPEKVPASKVTRYGAGLRYRCIRTNEMQVVSVL